MRTLKADDLCIHGIQHAANAPILQVRPSVTPICHSVSLSSESMCLVMTITHG